MRLVSVEVLQRQLENKDCPITNKLRYAEGFNDALLEFKSMLNDNSNIIEKSNEKLIDADELQMKLTKKESTVCMHRYTDGYNDALLRFKSMVHSAKTVESRVLIREEKIMQRNEYYASLSLNELAEEINNNSEWDTEQLQELCYRADMEEEWEQATDETFEAVVNKAADKLEITITGAYQLDRVEKEEKITVLLLEPEQEAKVIELDNSLESMQKTVGGNIEVIYPFTNDSCIVCNEEGKLLGLPLNRALYDDCDKIWEVIAGTSFICGTDDENFTSLSEQQIEHYSKQFELPEIFYRKYGTNEIEAEKYNPNLETLILKKDKQINIEEDLDI